MSIPKITVTPFPLAHEDQRRSIYEVVMPVPNTVRMTIIGPKESCSLGNHYHPEMEEVFLMTAGNARVVGQYIAEDGTPQGEQTSELVSAPAVVVVPKRVAHLFEFDGLGTLVCLASAENFEKVDYKLN